MPPRRHRLDQHGRARVAEGEPGERGTRLGQPVEPGAHRPGRRLAGHHQRPAGPAGQDHRAGQVDAVEEAVAGVGDVQRVRPAAQRRLHHVRGGRLGHVPGRAREQQQVHVVRVGAGVGEHLRGGIDRQVRGVLPVGGHPAPLDAGGLLEHPRRQRQPAGHGDGALQFGGGHLPGRQGVCDPGDPHIHARQPFAPAVSRA
jgi:hypothetical protein